MKEDYIQTFKNELRANDTLFVLPIFYQGGTVVKDISSHDIVVPLKQAGGCKAEVVENRTAVLERVSECNSVVIFGARDESLSLFADEIAAVLKNTG
jgi:UDP-N-acetylmuramate--alanine ligase